MDLITFDDSKPAACSLAENLKQRTSAEHRPPSTPSVASSAAAEFDPLNERTAASATATTNGVEHGTGLDPDMAAMDKTCDFVLRAVRSFNLRAKDSSSTHVKAKVASLNSELYKFLGGDEPQPGLSQPVFPPPRLTAEETRAQYVRFADRCLTSADSSQDHKHQSAGSAWQQPSLCSDSRLAKSDAIGSPPSDLVDLVSALSRMGRPPPRPEPYDMNAGESMDLFFDRFEAYCGFECGGRSNNPRYMDLWIGELKELLKGEALQAFNAYRNPGDSYQDLKRKMIEWRTRQQDLFHEDLKLQFSNARMYPEESLSLYAARLSKLFRAAYPHREHNNSTTLQQKYIKSVPSSVRSHLVSARSIQRAVDPDSGSTFESLARKAHEYEVDLKIFGEPETDFEVDLTSGTGKSSSNVSSNSSRQKKASPPQRQSRYASWTQRPVNRGGQGRETLSNRSGSRPSLPRGIDRDGSNFEPIGGRNFSNSQQQRSTSRLSSGARERSQSQGKFCNYCKLSGHVVRDCRRRLGQCFLCGSGEHRIANCPELQEVHEAEGGNPTPSVTRTNNSEN